MNPNLHFHIDGFDIVCISIVLLCGVLTAISSKGKQHFPPISQWILFLGWAMFLLTN